MPSRRAGAAGAQQLALSCQLCVRLEGAGGAVMPPAHRWELAPSPGSYGKAPLEGPVGQSTQRWALCLVSGSDARGLPLFNSCSHSA